MSPRRTASLSLFGIGLVLLVGALLTLAATRLGLLPAEGLEDLGRIVGAMLAAGLAGVAFAVGLLVAPPGSLPRWQVALAAAGCVPALVAGYAFVSTGTRGPMAFGFVVLALGVAGLFAALRLLRDARRRPARA